MARGQNVPVQEHVPPGRRRGARPTWPASGAFLDDQVAEAIDHAGLARKQERGGVELGEDGGAVDAGTDAEALAGIDGSPGGASLEGRSPPHGARKLLDVEVRRNEVLLRVHAGPGGGCDVAVGLGDFQDAPEGAIG